VFKGTVVSNPTAPVGKLSTENDTGRGIETGREGDGVGEGEGERERGWGRERDVDVVGTSSFPCQRVDEHRSLLCIQRSSACSFTAQAKYLGEPLLPLYVCPKSRESDAKINRFSSAGSCHTGTREVRLRCRARALMIPRDCVKHAT